MGVCGRTGSGKSAAGWVVGETLLDRRYVQLDVCCSWRRYRATGDKKYLDRMRRRCVVSGQTATAEWAVLSCADVKYFWGPWGWMVARGCGDVTVAAGEHPIGRDHEGFTMMMSSLLKYQGKDGIGGS